MKKLLIYISLIIITLNLSAGVTWASSLDYHESTGDNIIEVDDYEEEMIKELKQEELDEAKNIYLEKFYQANKTSQRRTFGLHQLIQYRSPLCSQRYS